MRKILVLRGGALGDFIVTLPALALLRARWPDARIELAGNSTAGALAKNRGLVDEVHSQHEGRWRALFTRDPMPPALARWLAEFDLVLNYWPDPDGELKGHFPLRADQAFLTAAAMPELAPAAAHYCAPLRALGLTATQFWHSLPPLRPVARAQHVIAVHPGSGSPRKNWPAERWQKLLTAITSPVILIAGEVEADTWKNYDRPGVTLALNLPLEELVARLGGCTHFVGHDSGISHLAAAAGVPCTLLFGPTDPATWAPPAPQVRVIKAGSTLEAISVDEVRATLPA
jgi:ADP-heptose:LPS heptosyltransferase